MYRLTLIILLTFAFVGCESLKYKGFTRNHEPCLDVNSCHVVIGQMITEAFKYHGRNRTDEFPDGLRATMLVRLAENKTIVSVAIAESSGNREFDLACANSISSMSMIVELEGLEQNVFEEHFKEFKIPFVYKSEHNQASKGTQ